MSNIALPPLSSLRAFEAIARFGSVTRAAENLRLTPSAVSHQIRSLEAHFGVQLVERRGRGIVLTNSGATYAAPVLKAFRELYLASDALGARKHDRVVRISMTPTFATLAALPNLDRFRKVHSDLDLRIEARNTAVDFSSDKIDAAVQLGTPPLNGMLFHRLFRSRTAPCIAPDVLERVGPIRSAEHLSELPLIEFSTLPNSWQAWFRENAPDLSPIEPELVGDSLLTALQMAKSGMGVILAPFPLVAPMVADGGLKALTLWPPFRLGHRDFYFTYPRLSGNLKSVRAVHRWLNGIGQDLERQAATLGL